MVSSDSMLSYAKSGTARPGDRLNGFENGKTQRFNSGGVAYFQKQWSIPLNTFPYEYSQGNSIASTILFKDI